MDNKRNLMLKGWIPDVIIESDKISFEAKNVLRAWVVFEYYKSENKEIAEYGVRNFIKLETEYDEDYICDCLKELAIYGILRTRYKKLDNSLEIEKFYILDKYALFAEPSSSNINYFARLFSDDEFFKVCEANERRFKNYYQAYVFFKFSKIETVENLKQKDEDSIIPIIDGEEIVTIVSKYGKFEIERVVYEELKKNNSIDDYKEENFDDKFVPTYVDWLQDERWKEKRLEILKEQGSVCSECGSKEKLVVHHLEYNFKDGAYVRPWEYPNSSFKVLCESCHNKVHKDDGHPLNPKTKAKRKKNTKTDNGTP